MNNKELKGLVKCIHKMWCGEPSFLDTPEAALRMHYHMSDLFNWAGITSTLVEKNPNEVSPEEFETRFIKKRKK